MPLFTTSHNAWIPLRDAVMVISWLGLLILVNKANHYQIFSILLYLLPTLFITRRYGLLPAFIYSALASLTLFPATHMQLYPQNSLSWLGMSIYCKLSGFSIGLNIAKYHRNQGQ